MGDSCARRTSDRPPPDCLCRGFTTVFVIATEIRCAACRCASDCRQDKQARAFGRLTPRCAATRRGPDAVQERRVVVPNALTAHPCSRLDRSRRPAAERSGDYVHFVDAGKIVTSVAAGWTNGISCSMKLPAIVGVYCCRVLKVTAVTAVESEIEQVTVNPWA